MDKTLIVALIAVGILVYYYIKSKESDTQTNESNKNAYEKKKLMSNTELEFYNWFRKLEPEYIVLPQINLAAIINKTGGFKVYQNELYRNLDFCIFDQNFEPLLAIEINDQTHLNSKRKVRDNRVKEILISSGIELLNYNVSYPNTEESVIQRTKKVLEEIQNKKN